VIALDRIALIDVEASSLGRDSYPIEVGWCFADTAEVESHLIRPLPDWSDWDVQAEAVHRIGRRELEQHGRAADQVSARMSAALRDRTLWADGSLDQRWINRLFAGAGLLAPEVRPFDQLLDQVVRPEIDGAGDWLARELARATSQGAIIDEAYARAGAIAPKVHRAGPDARYLHEVLRQVMILIEACRPQ